MVLPSSCVLANRSINVCAIWPAEPSGSEVSLLVAVPGKYNIRFQVLVVQEIPCHVDPGNSILRQCGP